MGQLNVWSEFRGLNHDFNPDTTSKLESENDKIQVQRHKIGNVSKETSTEVADMAREGRSGEKDQGSVNLMGTELQESTRKAREEFTGEGRIMDYEKS